MLTNSEKVKIEKYVDKLIKNIGDDVRRNINSQMSNKQVIDKVINVTVNKLTPESKTILSSAYNMMVERTLQESIFSNVHHKAAFNELNIEKTLREKFDFDIPKNIDYEESKATLNKWIASGFVVVIGGAISFSFKSKIPIGVSLIIVGIMAFLLKNNNINSKSVDVLITEYLENVKKSLLLWVDAIEQYYDEKVNELKGMLPK